ncbi:MAG: DNA internalization-related competence protein ComEC/Rec2 [Desulfobacteraceae bacterium]|nr:DNA internalization-related competence protein ComEC/Rec2 [Desulfobacteraceae bacterium]
MVKRPFVWIFIFFSIGIFSGEKINFPFGYTMTAALIFFILLAFYSLKNKKTFFIPLMFFYFTGILFINPHSKSSFDLNTKKFEIYNEKKREIRAVITDFPAVSFSKLKAKLKIISIDENDLESKNLNFTLSIYDCENNYKPGDIILFKAQINPYQNFRNPGGFDYESYMRLKNFYGHMWVSSRDVKLLGRKKNFDFFVFDIRSKISQIIDKNIKNKNNAAFLKSITCGLRHELDQDFKDMASKAGASHFMAISGLHIGMVFSFVYIVSRFIVSRFSFFLWRAQVKNTALVLGLFGAFFYALVSGLMPSAQRAFILALLGGAGFFFNKKADPLNLLFCCGFIILVLNPCFLFNIGFILSFEAVFSIICGFMAFPENMSKENTFFARFYKWLKILFKTSIFAVSGTFPTALYYFNILPLTGILSSVFLIPFFSFILLPFSFSGIIFSFLSDSISSFFFSGASYSSDIFIKIIKIVSDFKISYVNAGVSVFELYLIYFILIVIFWRFYLYLFSQRPDLRFKLIAFLSALIFLGNLIYVGEKRFFNKHGKIIFFDTGKGNSALIIFPGGKTALIDSGGFPGSDFDTGRYIIAPYLLKNKIKTIDFCISTHGDYDHYGGFFYILDNFNVKNFIFNNSIKTSGSYRKLMIEAKKRNIFSLREKVVFKGGIIDFYQSNDIFDNENDNSMLVSVFMENLKILFTGDLYKKSQEYYKKSEFIKNSDIFMVPHHGSIHSVHKEFILNSNPMVAVISGSFRNFEKTQEKVKKIYEDLGINVYNINENGAFVFCTDKSNSEILNFTGLKYERR